jgi:hypothetical protein
MGTSGVDCSNHLTHHDFPIIVFIASIAIAVAAIFILRQLVGSKDARYRAGCMFAAALIPCVVGLTWTDWVECHHDYVNAALAFLLAMVTGGLVLYTADLAARTRDLAQETQGSMILADYHHREGMQPIVTWLGEARYLTRQQTGQEYTRHIRYTGKLSNAGAGPAIDVTASFAVAGKFRTAQDLRLVGALGANMSLENIYGEIDLPASVGLPVNAGLPFEIEIRYRNLFRDESSTTHENVTGAELQTRTDFTPSVLTNRILPGTSTSGALSNGST